MNFQSENVELYQRHKNEKEHSNESYFFIRSYQLLLLLFIHPPSTHRLYTLYI